MSTTTLSTIATREDRENTVEALTQAAAKSLITMNELGDLVGQALNAPTIWALNKILATADLSPLDQLQREEAPSSGGTSWAREEASTLLPSLLGVNVGLSCLAILFFGHVLVIAVLSIILGVFVTREVRCRRERYRHGDATPRKSAPLVFPEPKPSVLETLNVLTSDIGEITSELEAEIDRVASIFVKASREYAKVFGNNPNVSLYFQKARGNKWYRLEADTFPQTFWGGGDCIIGYHEEDPDSRGVLLWTDEETRLKMEKSPRSIGKLTNLFVGAAPAELRFKFAQELGPSLEKLLQELDEKAVERSTALLELKRLRSSL